MTAKRATLRVAAARARPPGHAARAWGIAALVAVALVGGGAAEAAGLRVDYRITLAGLSLGNADLEGAFEDDRYDVRVKGQLTGMAGLFTGGTRASAAATGRLAGAQPTSGGFSGVGRSSSMERTVKLGVAGGNVTSVLIEPPLEEREDRVPVTPAQKRGVLDPLSALIAVARSRPDDPAACDRTLPVFDGSMRFDVVLSYAETRVVQKPGFAGPVLVCNARYVPIAGHRQNRPAIKFMEENRDMSVWLAPVEGTRVLVPLRISVRTTMGTSVIEAERWVLSGARPRP